MSPNCSKRYSKIKVRHQRKELDMRKKRIAGLTLVQDMGQNSEDPGRKQTSKATTGFTRAVREFGEQRRLFDTDAYASVVSKVKPRPKITKGRLTIHTQGLFARGKISKPACRGRRSRAPDCELHEIIRQAQENPRGQEYQLQKQHRRDCSPEVDDPDPLASPDQSVQSFDEPPKIHNDRFSPDYTSTKRQKEYRPLPGDSRPTRAETVSSTIVRDVSPTLSAGGTSFMSVKDMFSLLAKERLSPDSQDEDTGVREMELEENVMDGMTKWITRTRAALNCSDLGYLQEARQYLKDLHKETVCRELKTAVVTQIAIAEKPTEQTLKVSQYTLEKTANKIPEVVEISLSKFRSRTRNNKIELEMPQSSNHTTRQQKQLPGFKDQNRCHLEAWQTDDRASNTKNSYEPLAGNPFSHHNEHNATYLESHKTICNTNGDAAKPSETSDESFNFSPNVSSIIEFPTAFGLGKAPQQKKEQQNGNSCRLREGRERVHQFQVDAVEERERLRQNKEWEHREKITVYKEKLRSYDRTRGQSCSRPELCGEASPRRSNKGIRYNPSLDQKLWNATQRQFRGQSREGMRRFGEENRDWYIKDEVSKGERYNRPSNGERSTESSSFQQAERKLKETGYQPYDLRSPQGLPDWLLEKTPERVFRPRKMFD